MNRRRLIGVLALSIIFHPELVMAKEPIMPFAEWVRQLYEAELKRRSTAQAAGLMDDLPEAELHALFTPEIQALFANASNRTLSPSEPDGPNLHWLFGWGALPGRTIVLDKVSDRSWLFGGGTVVDLIIEGNARELVLFGELDQIQHKWLIDDIDYGDGGLDRSLRDRLERMATWPLREP